MKSNSIKMLNGSVKRHPDGFGFFIPDKSEVPDVYIPRESMEHVMTQDRVLVSVQNEKGSQRLRGEIIKIIERGQKKVVGKLRLNPKGAYLRDESKAWGQDLQVTAGETLGAKEGQFVAVEITKYPDQGYLTGKVVKIIGDLEDPLSDIQRVLNGLQIPQDFSGQTQNEVSRLKEIVDPADIAKRKDLRNLNFITIDGATAKDFDDAIYIEKLGNGFKLWVAIADVSHYVRPNSAIDKDAFERGTSVYFPNFVVPMLPEILSNGLCSLKPNVDRLTLVAEIDFDFQGQVQKDSFYEATINSKARVTYGEAQQVIDSVKNSTPGLEKLKHVKDEIIRAKDLAEILMAKRFREGSLDLDIPETTLLIDDTGNPVEITKTERLFAHRLIEEMMLAANVSVAKFLSSFDTPSIYRIHEPPPGQALEILARFLNSFGAQTHLSGGLLQKKLTRALQEFQGKPQALILNILTLRSMAQAKYSTQNAGHFGLGFEYYTHFTSPIRRYPDLIVHRLIKSSLKIQGYRLVPQDELSTAATLLSACEQRATKSERQFQAIKKARFMQKHVGEELEGIISSVTRFGAFVLVRPFEVDGLVPLDSLSPKSPADLEFDPDTLRLISRRSGHTFELGQPLRVRLVRVDVELGQIDFELVKDLKVQVPGERVQTRSQRNSSDRGSRNSSDRGKDRSAERSKNKRSEPSGRRKSESTDAPKASGPTRLAFGKPLKKKTKPVFKRKKR